MEHIRSVLFAEKECACYFPFVTQRKNKMNDGVNVFQINI